MNRARGSAVDARVHASLWNLRGKTLSTAEGNSRRELWERPKHAPARAILARAHFERGDDVEAIRLLLQASYDDPGHCEAHDLLVQIYKHLGRYDLASDIYAAWAMSVLNSSDSRMEYAMDQGAVDATSFDVNPKLDIQLLGNAYRGSQRLHIPNFLSPADADRLYQHLHTEITWRTFLVANGRQLGTPPNSASTLSVDEEREMIEFAHRGARDGFASLFDANRLLAEEAARDDDTPADMSLFSGFLSFVNSPIFMGLCRRITGISELTRVDAQATRFRAGHFVTFHNAVRSAEETGKRRASYVLDLTPEWRPEWGGMIEFRGQEGSCIEAIQPCFNTLDLFAFPQGYWISAVAPFARGPRYAIFGHMYSA